MKGRRLAAAAYLRKLVPLFPEAAEPLNAAASHYDHEMESLQPIYDVCAAARKKEAWTAEDRAQARSLIGEALKADRDAVAQIEVALEILDGS